MEYHNRSQSVSSVRSRSKEIIFSITAKPFGSKRALSVERSSKFRRNQSSSRNASPTRPASSRGRKLQKALGRSAATSREHLPAQPETIAPKVSGVRRWDGNQRMVTKWDSIRKDSELWLPNGDCLVHFYERGVSRRGASMLVSLADVESSKCMPLLARYYTSSVLRCRSSQDSDAGYEDAFPVAQHELFIPAPEGLTKDETNRFHLTTRNFFAWLYEKPLVTDRLGEAMASILGRINEYRSASEEQNKLVFMNYLEDQGYLDYRDCPDHALALLQFAEKCKYQDLWRDAFAHCVGMNEQLESSAEFEHVSRSSQALITRAHIELQVRLERAGRSISDFLETDLSENYLGLHKEAISHMERFRSFLHTHYVGQYCYWPPAPASFGSQALSPSVYRSLYADFRKLFDYLVDSRPGMNLEDKYPIDGGICLYQKVKIFDKKNKYVTLSDPLPLLPKTSHTISHRKSLFKLSLFGIGKQAKLDRRIAAAAALADATNHSEAEIMENSLVHEYLQFEKAWTIREQAGSLNSSEARKIRWILVYAILQLLTSVTKIPAEVRDTEGVTYPLSCQMAGTPPWHAISKSASTSVPPIQPCSVDDRNISLRDKILESKREKDAQLANTPSTPVAALPAKPAPLTVPTRNTDTASPSANAVTSFANRLTLRAPAPIRTRSRDMLAELTGKEHDLNHEIEDATPKVTPRASFSNLSIIPTPSPFKSARRLPHPTHHSPLPVLNSSPSSTPTTPGTASNADDERSSTSSNSLNPHDSSTSYSSSSSDNDNSSSDGYGDGMDHLSIIDDYASAASSDYGSDKEGTNDKANENDTGLNIKGLTTKPLKRSPAIPEKSAKRQSLYSPASSAEFIVVDDVPAIKAPENKIYLTSELDAYLSS